MFAFWFLQKMLRKGFALFTSVEVSSEVDSISPCKHVCVKVMPPKSSDLQDLAWLVFGNVLSVAIGSAVRMQIEWVRETNVCILLPSQSRAGRITLVNK